MSESSDSDLSKTLPWLLLLLVVAAAFAALLSVRWLSAGALVGAGALMTLVGLAFLLLPLGASIDLGKAFEPPRPAAMSYLHWDGSLPFLGVILLVLGIRRWQSDIARLQQVMPPVRVSNPQPPSRLPYAGQQGYPAAPADQPGDLPQPTPSQPAAPQPGSSPQSPSRHDQSRQGQLRQEQQQQDQAHPDQPQQGQLQQGSGQSARAQPSPPDPAPAEAGPVQLGLAPPGLAQPASAQSAPPEPRPAQPGPPEPGPAQPGVAQPGLAESERSQAEPGQLRPGQPGSQPGRHRGEPPEQRG